MAMKDKDIDVLLNALQDLAMGKTEDPLILDKDDANLIWNFKATESHRIKRTDKEVAFMWWRVLHAYGSVPSDKISSLELKLYAEIYLEGVINTLKWIFGEEDTIPSEIAIYGDIDTHIQYRKGIEWREFKEKEGF